MLHQALNLQKIHNILSIVQGLGCFCVFEKNDHYDIDGLVEERRNSGFVQELPLSCTNPKILGLRVLNCVLSIFLCIPDYEVVGVRILLSA